VLLCVPHRVSAPDGARLLVQLRDRASMDATLCWHRSVVGTSLDEGMLSRAHEGVALLGCIWWPLWSHRHWLAA
jgi:hypothetical protein